MMRNAGFHRRRNAQRAVNPAELVAGEAVASTRPTRLSRYLRPPLRLPMCEPRGWGYFGPIFR
jgi:hypothetical protein